MIFPLSQRLLHFALPFLCGFILSSPSMAQNNAGISGEDVAIAFFKTGGTNPDFDTWAKGSRNYKVAPPARAQDVLTEEKQRLITKWRTFTGDSMLDIHAPVKVELKTTTTQNGDDQYWMYMMFKIGDVTYFPYKYLDYKFAIIPQQIETLMIQPLQKEQYDAILQEFFGQSHGDAVLSLQLKPVKSYMDQPYVIDDREQWALLCNIASMTLLTDKKLRPLWNYGSDWYVSPQNQQLRDLYHAPSEGTQAR